MRATLASLLDGLGVAGKRDCVVTSVVCDSRQARAGSVFVAVRGYRYDGRDFARDALARGAVAVVCEAPAPPGIGSVVLVPDARAALARMSCRFHGHPSRHMALAGVTGTNGKTTTAALLAETLRRVGGPVGLMTTVQIEIGQRVIPASRTTPEAPVLQAMLASMREAGCERAVIEVSSHALDQRRADDTRFGMAVFTNLTRDHLDYHGSFDAYFAAKCRLFDMLEPPHACATINADDPWGQILIARMRDAGIPVRSYGIATGDYRAVDLRLDVSGSAFRLQGPGGVSEVRASLLGRHNVYNLLAAAAAAEGMGVAPDVAPAAFEAFAPRWGRLERVPLSRPGAVFVDYAHTDDALANVLKTLREITPGRLTVVFGCGGDRDAGKRPIMGRVAAEGADRLVVTADNPRSEDSTAIIEDILAGVPEETACDVCPDRRDAIALAMRDLRKGDSVLIAGKGHESYQELAHTVTPFDDRDVVRSIDRGDRR